MTNEKELYRGKAIGGPLDGQDLESRFPNGVVLVHSPDAVAWIYDYVDTPDGGQFECRDRDKARGGAQRLDQAKVRKAAEGSKYDVRAYDDGEIPEGLEVGK